MALDMYEKMYRVAKRENVDFVMSDYQRICADGRCYLKTLDIPSGLYEKKQMRRIIFPNLIMGENIEYGPLLSVWHCLYRTDFLRQNNLCFDEKVRWSEDNIFSAIAGYCCERFYYMKGEGLYHYYQNQGTITTSYRSGAWQVYCTMNEHLHNFFDPIKDFDFSRQLKLHMIYYACNCIGQELTLPKLEAKRGIRNILETRQLRDSFTDFKMPRAGIKLKIQLYLMKYRQTDLLYQIKKAKD